jgi:hypothetical protein
MALNLLQPALAEVPEAAAAAAAAATNVFSAIERCNSRRLMKQMLV